MPGLQPSDAASFDAGEGEGDRRVPDPRGGVLREGGMSLFASRRNTRTEERVILMELRDLLDAREIPGDGLRRAQFWAEWHRSGAQAGGLGLPSPPVRVAAPRAPVHQDPLFPNEEMAA